MNAYLTQDLLLELLLLPAIALAFVTSLLTARELAQRHHLVHQKVRASDIRFRIAWHVCIPVCGVICGAVLLLDTGPNWVLFGDSTEVLLILLAWLALRGPGGSPIASRHRLQPVADVVAIHLVAILTASFGATVMTSVFAALFAIETHASVHTETTNIFTGVLWEQRQVASQSLVLVTVPAIALSVWLWSWLVLNRQRPVSTTAALLATAVAVTGSTGLTLAIAWWPMPVISGAIAECVAQFPLQLLMRGGLLLLIVSFITTFELSAHGEVIHVPATHRTLRRQQVTILTCITAVITVNWIPVLQAVGLPLQWSADYWVRGLNRAWRPEFAPMNLLYFAILVMIAAAYIRHWKRSHQEHSLLLTTVEWSSLWLRLPAVFAASILTVLSVFWCATGLWMAALTP